ncbi:MAG: GNAT family N-acetyltransferase [Bacteroidota bacterium]
MQEMDYDELVVKKLKPSDFISNTNGQIQALFKQLNASITQRNALEVAHADTTVFIACWHKDKIVGMALMATYKVISGHKGMIEDVVVDEGYRGRGIGKKLMKALLQAAKTLGLSEILLFSGNHRTAAISLYTSLGFVLKDSGLYRLPLN